MRLPLVVVMVGAGCVLIAGTLSASWKDSRSAAPAVATGIIPVASRTLVSADTAAALAAVVGQADGVVAGVRLVDLANGANYSYGQTDAFTAASTTKLLTAALVLHEVESGDLALNQFAGSARVEWHLRQMVLYSNNDSWAVLNSLVGSAALEAYADQLGLTSYQFATNQISVADEARLLEYLANGTLLNEANSILLLSFMQNTNNEDLIPAALPAEATVYHKYGLLDGNLHDAAIVEYGGRRFVLVIYTSSQDGSLNYPDRQMLIQALAQTVLAGASLHVNN